MYVTFHLESSTIIFLEVRHPNLEHCKVESAYMLVSVSVCVSVYVCLYVQGVVPVNACVHL